MPAETLEGIDHAALEILTFHTIAYSVVLDCFYKCEIGVDFSIHCFWSHWITSLQYASRNARGIDHAALENLIFSI